MGGKKKLSFKQIERTQAREQKRKEKTSSITKREKIAAGIAPPDSTRKQFAEEIKKVQVLTPYTISSHFNIRISVAKNLLEELERRGTIKYVSGSRGLKIYQRVE
jgi:ribosomal protein S25